MDFDTTIFVVIKCNIIAYIKKRVTCGTAENKNKQKVSNVIVEDNTFQFIDL